MPTIDLNASGFEGRSRSFTVLTGGKGWATCSTCGSTLYPSRRESSKVRTVDGSGLNVEKVPLPMWPRPRGSEGRSVIPTAEAVQAPPQALIDPRVAKHGGTRRNAKANYDFPGMMDAASWRRTEVHKHTSWYGCLWCGQGFAGPHAVYTHIAKRHPERFQSEDAPA